MARSTTTPDLVAAILRPVRGVMAGVARRMGAPLSEPAGAGADTGADTDTGAGTNTDTGAFTVTEAETVTEAGTNKDTGAAIAWDHVARSGETVAWEERAPERANEPALSAAENQITSDWPPIQRPVYRMRRPTEPGRADRQWSAPASDEAKTEPSAPPRFVFSMRTSPPAAYAEENAPLRTATRVELAKASGAKPEALVAEPAGGAPAVESLDDVGSAPRAGVVDKVGAARRVDADPDAYGGVISSAPRPPAADAQNARRLVYGESVAPADRPRPELDIAAITAAAPSPEVAGERHLATSPEAAPITTVMARPEIAGITSVTPRIDPAGAASLTPAAEQAQPAATNKPLRLVFEESSSPAAPPLAAGTAAFAGCVAQAASVVWDDARRVTHEALTVERSDASAAAAALPAQAVSNTFNVNVHVDPDQTGALSDREALEQALCDVLRDAARRHGIEV